MTILGVMFWRPVQPWIVPDNYRWWTVSASKAHLKVGPVAVAWYRWTRCYHVDLVILCRWTVTVPSLEVCK